MKLIIPCVVYSEEDLKLSELNIETSIDPNNCDRTVIYRVDWISVGAVHDGIRTTEIRSGDLTLMSPIPMDKIEQAIDEMWLGGVPEVDYFTEWELKKSFK